MVVGFKVDKIKKKSQLQEKQISLIFKFESKKVN